HQIMNDQFRETPAERNRRLRERRFRRSIETLQDLIADLTPHLSDEDVILTPDAVDALRSRCANALPPDKCPDWLQHYRDPPVTAGADPDRMDRRGRVIEGLEARLDAA